MENQNDKKESVEEQVRRIIGPVFDKVPHAHQPNHTVVGVVTHKPGVEEGIKFLWQPHNYRLYFDFDKGNFKAPTMVSGKGGSVVTMVHYSLGNYDSEHIFRNWYGCRVVIKKNVVEVINKWHEKQWRLITAANIGEVDARIKEVVEQMDAQCVDALKKLIARFGGVSNFEVLKRRAEHGIHGDDYLDKIPEDMVIHDTVFKKVYENKVEFYDHASVKNYVANRAVESIAPEISKELVELRQMQLELGKMQVGFQKAALPVLHDFAENFATHVTVMKRIDVGLENFNKTVDKLNARLSQRRLSDYVG